MQLTARILLARNNNNDNNNNNNNNNNSNKELRFDQLNVKEHQPPRNSNDCIVENDVFDRRSYPSCAGI